MKFYFKTLFTENKIEIQVNFPIVIYTNFILMHKYRGKIKVPINQKVAY